MTAQQRDEGALFAPGDLVSGEYVVDAVAQRGPGWIAYRGHHVERTDELVMITSLRADAPSAGYIEAFAKRSQWLAEVRIPNVPPLLASGVEMGLPFIVTPWVEGPTLRELLAAEGSLSRDEALRIIKAIGDSLDAMHARRPVVVHQLLSLDNIRIDSMTRAVWVMDAGVAHALRLARVDDVHAAAKIDGVFRAPEDTVGRIPSPAIDRYALAKLAEVLLSPVPAGSALARVLSRGRSDLAASRFSTCASFVQSLTLALKEVRPSNGAKLSPPSAATQSPTVSAMGAAHEPAPSLLATASHPAGSPSLRSSKSTIVGIAPPALSAKPMAETRTGIAPSSDDVPSPGDATTMVPASSPTKSAALPGVERSHEREEEQSAHEPERIEIEPAEPGRARQSEGEKAGHAVVPPTASASAASVPVVVGSDARDLDQAKMTLASEPVAIPSTASAIEPMFEPKVERDETFPRIPPLDPTEKERQAQQQAVDVPPLFEVPPPVPTPIEPSMTSGGAPVRIEKAQRSRYLAIAIAVMLGLGGGIGGGLFVFDRWMKGDASAGMRSVARIADTGVSAIHEPVQNAATSTHGTLTQNPLDDHDVMLNTRADRDPLAMVAWSEDASTGTGIEDAMSVIANYVVEDGGTPELANGANVTSIPQASAVSEGGSVATEPTVPEGVTVVAGAAGLPSPNGRIRAAARRLVKERVERCGQGSVRGTARFAVRFDGATGRVIEFHFLGNRFHNTPVGACIESAMRSIALPQFTDRRWDTDYAVALR
jgi:serine/threonine protein kinase